MKTLFAAFLLLGANIALAACPTIPGDCPANQTFVPCATGEGSTCSFAGTRRKIRYGSAPGPGQRFVTKVFDNNVVCSSANFGGDPANGAPKFCSYSPAFTVSSTVTFTKTQIFAMANSGVTVPQGGNVLWQMRYYVVPFQYDMKPFTHLINVATGAVVNDNFLDAGNHYWLLNLDTDTGYREYQYQYNINAAYVPVGTYRLEQGVYQGMAPYLLDTNLYECNGIATSTRSGKTCVIGTFVVSGSIPRLTNLTVTQGITVLTGTTWTP